MTERFLLSFATLSLLLLTGKWLRVKVPWFRKLYLPSSVVAGLFGLLVLAATGERLPASWTAGWSTLPGILINVVFASLFLGTDIPPLRTAWRRAGPQLAYGQLVAWGQYVAGLGLVLLVLRPLFGVPALFGVLVPVGFEGGHGTAAGLRSTFEKLGWEHGADLALTSATIGILGALVCGVALINWALRHGHVREMKPLEELPEAEQAGFYSLDSSPSAGRQTILPASLDSLAFHLAVVGVAILVGIVLRRLLVGLLGLLPGDAPSVIAAAFPLFPLCMLGGILVQILLTRCGKRRIVDIGLMRRCGGTAMDFLVTAAVATINLRAVGSAWIPIMLIGAVGIGWNLVCVRYLARRLLPDAWFERSICEMGQSMGVTATGLLLLRMVDPENRTNAGEAFAYKQLFHEPFMGGGLWTSTAVSLVVVWGGPVVLGISLTAMGLWWLALRFVWRT